eukprot:snap_masked-scaffold_13-processed-gene-5.29-mRNA-1 protein AED:1.00 eAED:1.00 QI:0/0/0/0/1/1/2/0/73
MGRSIFADLMGFSEAGVNDKKVIHCSKALVQKFTKIFSLSVNSSIYLLNTKSFSTISSWVLEGCSYRASKFMA